MRLVCSVLALSALSAPAFACSDQVLTVTRWEPAEAEGIFASMYTAVAVEVRNDTDRTITMVDGHVVFSDVLDRTIGRFSLEPDTLREPNVAIMQAGVSTDATADRLNEIDPSSVLVSTCVTGVVYNDGTVERFD